MTRLHGDFPPAPLAQLGAEHQRFIETFVTCRGIIRDVERALGISYPTVRARLDAAVAALEATLTEERGDAAASRRVTTVEEAEERDAQRRRLLRRVEAGELAATDAADALRSL